MDGFPGVNLVGSANGGKPADYQWQLTRATERYSAVAVPPRGTAHFGIVYLPFDVGTAGQTLAVTTIIMTPPNDRTSKQLRWSKILLLQDSATHPGTWLTPVQAGP
jgi:hypothetical protein